MADDAWGLAEAKAKFSELVERARSEGPQYVARNGKPAVVVVSAEEWARKSAPRMTLYEFLERSPLRDSGIELDLERDRDVGRDIKFD